MIKSFFLYICFVGIVWGCGQQQSKSPALQILPMDSSASIIMNVTGLLDDSCIPDCWPRDFSKKKPSKHYVAYVETNTYSKKLESKRKFEDSKRYFPEIDSPFYQLIDCASGIKEQRIGMATIRSLTNKQVRVGLINGLKGKLEDNELGYITLSPVVLNEQGDKGVFIYELNGELRISWLFCIKKQNNQWVVVSKSRLAIS